MTPTKIRNLTQNELDLIEDALPEVIRLARVGLISESATTTKPGCVVVESPVEEDGN